MNRFRPDIALMLIILIIAWKTDAKAQDGTMVFDQEIVWEWPTSENDYGGYGFYWWHRKESVVNINYGNMSSTDWTSPDNYYDGEFVLRFEILDQPTSEDFYIQFGIWQDRSKGTAHPETASSRQYVEGGNGTTFRGSLGSPSTWWNKQGDDPVDFTRPEDFYRIGIVLWNADPLCIPKGDDWGGGCPELEKSFFPMRAKLTLTAYPSGAPLDNSVNAEDKLINIYPNPASDEFVLEYFTEFRENNSFTIYDYKGRSVKSGLIRKNTPGTTINISNIPDGIYFLKVQSEDNSLVKKLMIQR